MIALGLLGLVLPGLQGLLFLAIGSLLLAPDVPLFGKLVDWMENRFPALRHPLQEFRRRIGRGRTEPGDPAGSGGDRG